MKHLALSLFVTFPALLSADLVAWFPLNGSTKDRVKGTVGEFEGDSHFGQVDRRQAADFGGHNGVVFVADSPQFALGPSFSVSAQVWVRSLPRNGTSPQGQIVFRGDDRSANDNYSLCLGNDGFYTFNFDGGDDHWAGLRVPSRTNVWTTLLGTFDAKTRHIMLYVDGYLAAEQYTPYTPLMLMDKNCSPGFSIGNVQNPLGGNHNQPFNGLIRDVKLYNTAINWDDLSREPRLADSTPKQTDLIAEFFN